MRNNLGAFDPEQLRAIQILFDQAWFRATGSVKVNAVTDWGALRNEIAARVFEYVQTNLTDDEIIRAVLASLGIL